MDGHLRKEEKKITGLDSKNKCMVLYANAIYKALLSPAKMFVFY